MADSPEVTPAFAFTRDNPPARIASHDVVLDGERVRLRPMTEDDWPSLLAWNRDPDVLYLTDGPGAEPCGLAETQAIYRSVCAHAFCFIIEFEARAIGECWLQRMNLQAIVDRHRGRDVRRIDIVIGAKGLWGQGLGTEAVSLLTSFGFENEGADAIYGIVYRHNPRSRRLFEKLGFYRDAAAPPPVEPETIELVITRD